MTPRLIVTCATDHDGAYWTARVSCNGASREFHNRYGTWQTDRRPRADSDWPRGAARREAAPAVAAVLQRRVGRKARRG